MSECSVERQCPPVREICTDYGKCTTHGTCDEEEGDKGNNSDCQCTVNVMCDRAEGEGGEADEEGIGRAGRDEGDLIKQLRGGGKTT